MRKEASILGYVISTDTDDENLKKLRAALIDFIIARLLTGLYKKVKRELENNVDKFKDLNYKKLLFNMDWYFSMPHAADLCIENGLAWRVVNDTDYALVFQRAGIDQGTFETIRYIFKTLCEAKKGPLNKRIIPEHASASLVGSMLSRILSPRLETPEKGYYDSIKFYAERLGLPIFSNVSDMINFYVLEDPIAVFAKNQRVEDPLLSSLKEESLDIEQAKEMDEQALKDRRAKFMQKDVQNIMSIGTDVELHYFELNKLSRRTRRAIQEYLDGIKSASEVQTIIGKWEGEAKAYVRSIVEYLSGFAYTTDEEGNPLVDYSVFAELSSLNMNPHFSEDGIIDVFDVETWLFHYNPELAEGPRRTALYPFVKVAFEGSYRVAKVLEGTLICVGEKIKNSTDVPEWLKDEEEKKEELLEGCP